MSEQSKPDPGESGESMAIAELAIASRGGATILASRDDVDSFMRALQRTLLFRIEWQDLLSAGPESLVHMGECFMAVHATSNPSLPLFDSASSVPGLPNISLISNVLHVSDVGVEAFNIANRRMDEMYEISDTVDSLLDDIIRGIRGLPSPAHVRQLRSKLQAFQESATDATECATKAHKAFSDWDILLGKLRRAILDKQGATLPTLPTLPPPPPPAPDRPTLPVPSIPSLTAPTTEIINFVKAARADDPIWAELPGIEAWHRRMYGFVTYGAGGVSFPGLATTTAGRAYVVNMCNQLERHIQRLNGSSPTQIAVTCHIIDLLTNFTAGLRPMLADPSLPSTTAGWQGWVVQYWGRVDGMILQAKRLGFIPLDLNTWDSTDMIDIEYYRRSGIVIPTVQPTSPTVRPPQPGPSMPAMAPTASGVVWNVERAQADDPIWAEIADIEACFRRFYGLVNYGAGGVAYPIFPTTVLGRTYMASLAYKFDGFTERLNQSRQDQVAVTCSVLTFLQTWVTLLRQMIVPGATLLTTANASPGLLGAWSQMNGILVHGKLAGLIPGDLESWDLTDIVDIEFYKRASIPIPPVDPTPRPPVPSPGPIPGPNPDLNGLVQCTDALAKVRREVKKVIRFFDAVSVLGQNVISVHVRSFRNDVESVISRDPTGKLTEQERSDLVRHARSVKAYFSVIRAVASMYIHIHSTYVAEGLDLLVELSMSNTTHELRILRQRSLENYARSVATELADYITRKQRSIIAEIRSEVEEITGGF